MKKKVAGSRVVRKTVNVLAWVAVLLPFVMIGLTLIVLASEGVAF